MGTAAVAYDFDETKMKFHKHIGGKAEVNETVVMDRVHVTIPRIGNATAVAHVYSKAGHAHIKAQVSFDVCGNILDQKGCISDLPFGPFPLHVINIDKDFGDFCDALDHVAV